MDKDDYQAELRKLQVELARMQRWVRHSGARVVIVFEGRDTAGKGGMIKAITAKVSSRVFRVVALPAPNDRERTQLYLQRYISHMPAAGEVVMFDRSWYNRAGVEPVMGFCTPEESEQFLADVPTFERWLVRSGIVLIKYWLEVGEKEQKDRLLSRIEDPVKRWKIGGLDLEGRRRWYEYSHARDRMLERTDTKDCPWYIVPTDDKYSARLNCISHLLDTIPYQPLEAEKIELPPRDQTHAYDDEASIANRRFVPDRYHD